MDNARSGKRFMEKLLLMRGIRKLPYKLRNRVFFSLFRSSLYPVVGDYKLFPDKEFIEKKCHVLFAVCIK